MCAWSPRNRPRQGFVPAPPAAVRFADATVGRLVRYPDEREAEETPQGFSASHADPHGLRFKHKEKFMQNKLKAVATIALVSLAVSGSDMAQARHHYYGHSRYEHRCRSGNGAVGTIAGGVGGAAIGSAAGGVGGALLGRHLDKAHTRHRNGC